MALKTRVARAAMAKLETAAKKLPTRVVERVVTRALAPTMSITKGTEDYTELRRRSEAPRRVDVHAPQAMKARVSQARKVERSDQAKEIRDSIADRLVRKALPLREVDRDTLESLTATQLKDVAKSLGTFPGYSGMKKDELVDYLATGERPDKEESEERPAKSAPKAGTVGELRERAKAYKASGLIAGPVSSASKATLEAAVVAAAAGQAAVVAKAPAKAGTMESNKNLLRGSDGKFTEAASKMAKVKFQVSISALKALQLTELVKVLGLAS